MNNTNVSDIKKYYSDTQYMKKSSAQSMERNNNTIITTITNMSVYSDIQTDLESQRTSCDDLEHAQSTSEHVSSTSGVYSELSSMGTYDNVRGINVPMTAISCIQNRTSQGSTDEDIMSKEQWRGTIILEGCVKTTKYQAQLRGYIGKAANTGQLVFAENEYGEFQPAIEKEVEKRIVEVYGFAQDTTTENILAIFRSYVLFRGATIRWVDDTHLLLLTPSEEDANAILSKRWPFCKVRSMNNSIYASQCKMWLHDLGSKKNRTGK